MKKPWLELPLVWIGYLSTEIHRKECDLRKDRHSDQQREREVLLAGAKRHLEIAEKTCTQRRLIRTAPVLQRIWGNIRAANVDILALSSDEELRARSSIVRAMVEHHISQESPQRVQAERAIEAISTGQGKITEEDRETLISALRISYSSLDAKYRRVRVFANVLWAATGLSLLGAAALAIWGAFDAQTLSLCFENRDVPIENEGDATTQTVIVCPTGEHKPLPGMDFPDDYANRLDVFSVELAGLTGAALTTVSSLRKIHDDHNAPYTLPLAAATLKLPLGAISAFAGILFIRGGFLPGLSALDSPVQIIAWAIVFGASQQFVTHIIDRQAQVTLSDVQRTPEPAPPRRPNT
ncbi:hypothetical protein AB0929_14915 [Streptomyces massasporeus]|uniref:hypothetical protein n=1 Tax=Streptomyces massasporeus TaxID=67324 RepID=UPI0034538EE4